MEKRFSPGQVITQLGHGILQTAVLHGHTNIVYGIATSPNGRILASASSDNTARLWNLENGQPIGLPLEHAESVKCVSLFGRWKTTSHWLL
jgi:WD40 repeat protein